MIFRIKQHVSLILNPMVFSLLRFLNLNQLFSARLCRKKIFHLYFIDGFIEDTGFLAYIGENIFQSGRVAGQLIDMITPVNSDILIVSIAKNLRNVHHLDKRADGFLSLFQKWQKTEEKKLFSIFLILPREQLKKSIDKISLKIRE